MGDNHPLRVRLKRNIKWYKLIYKWNAINKHINEWAILNKIILQKYKKRLISKPIYEYTSNEINVVIYEYKKNIRKLKIMKERKNIIPLLRGIREVIKKPIKINVIRLKYLQLDTMIMCRYYQIGLKNNSIASMRRKVKKRINPCAINIKEKKYSTNWYKWTDISQKRINTRIISGIRGIYIEINGRISKHRRVKRSKKDIINKGTLEFNKVSNILDFDQIKTIGVNGVYNIKICINTCIAPDRE